MWNVTFGLGQSCHFEIYDNDFYIKGEEFGKVVRYMGEKINEIK